MFYVHSLEYVYVRHIVCYTYSNGELKNFILLGRIEIIPLILPKCIVKKNINQECFFNYNNGKPKI